MSLMMVGLVFACMLCGMLLLSDSLRPAIPTLAVLLRWLALLGMPSILIGGLALSTRSVVNTAELALLLGIGAIFYMLAARTSPRTAWGLLIAVLLLFTLNLAGTAAQISVTQQSPGFVLLGLAYLIIGAALEQRSPAVSRPLVLFAPLVAGIAFPCGLIDSGFALASLPLLSLFGLVLVALVERGSFGWLGAWRSPSTILALFSATWLVPIWILLTPFPFSGIVQFCGLVLLAILYYVGAYWGPGQLAPGYRKTLLVIATQTVFLIANL